MESEVGLEDPGSFLRRSWRCKKLCEDKIEGKFHCKICRSSRIQKADWPLGLREWFWKHLFIMITALLHTVVIRGNACIVNSRIPSRCLSTWIGEMMDSSESRSPRYFPKDTILPPYHFHPVLNEPLCSYSNCKKDKQNYFISKLIVKLLFTQHIYLVHLL